MIKGFVNFPNDDKEITTIDDGKTIVNMVVFDVENSENVINEPSNTHLVLDNVFVSDNVMSRPTLTEFKDLSVDELVSSEISSNKYIELYFPNFNSDMFQPSEISKYLSIPLLSSVVLGNLNMTFERKEGGFWNASFEDLTKEGKELFYSLKKLYPDKEVRILTFVEDII